MLKDTMHLVNYILGQVSSLDNPYLPDAKLIIKKHLSLTKLPLIWLIAGILLFTILLIIGIYEPQYKIAFGSIASIWGVICLISLFLSSNRQINKITDIAARFRNMAFNGSYISYITASSLISPADLVDKITILKIKRDKLKDKLSNKELKSIKQDMGAHFVLLKLRCEYDEIFKNWPESLKLEELTKQLLKSNEDQWDAENRVRQEHSWEAAVAARELNTQRTKIKNDINFLFRHNQEIKEY